MNEWRDTVKMGQIFEMPGSFYPTPAALIDKMLSGIDFNYKQNFLEPSAGKGNIIRRLFEKANSERDIGETINVDCIELDINLRQILKYNFSPERERIISAQIKDIKDKREWDSKQRKYVGLSEGEILKLRELENEELTLPQNNNLHIVHDDFLTFSTFKKYDVIVMNPPFDEGDKHLIKAMEIQKNGGDIVCLLNAETLKNPYTNIRKHLVAELNRYEAEIQYLQGEFETAETERKTSVEVALVKISIPEKRKSSFIFEKLNKAQKEEIEHREATELTTGDLIQNIIDQFNLEVKCALELIREYDAMKPYMLRSFNDYDKDTAILTLTLAYGKQSYTQGVDVNEYLPLVRMKYWSELFKRPQFTGMLTSNLQEDYHNMVEKLKDYDFSYYNIRQVQAEMNDKLIKGVEETILALFENLSAEHSWYPECSRNIHYFSGWATNKAYKINKKVIIPIHGAFATYSWNKETFRENTVYSVLSDIEKVMNYLDSGETEEVDMSVVLKKMNAEGITKKIPLKYFNVTLYKKGTCHIEFNNQRLLDKFNIFGCRHKNWLPPSYGKKKYSDMTDTERAAVDEFQGREEYEKVFNDTKYYLVETSDLLMLGSADAERA